MGNLNKKAPLSSSKLQISGSAAGSAWIGGAWKRKSGARRGRRL